MKPIIAMHTNFDFIVTADDRSTIEDLAPSYEVILGRFDQLTHDQLSRIEIIYGNPAPALLYQMPQLHLLQLQTAGADGYCDPLLYRQKDIRLCNGSGIYGLPIAEHILACFLSMNRNIPAYRDQQHKKEWTSHMTTLDFYGSTVAILGLGDIGLRLATMCHALGATVLGIKRTIHEKPACVAEQYTLADIDAVLPRADFIAMCLPGTAETVHVMTKSRLALLKPTAILVNIGRGSSIDQDALIECMRLRTFAGVAIDVSTPEPLPASSPLWEMDNVLITAHSSGRSPTNKSRSLGIFQKNLSLYESGKPAYNLVDFTLKY